MENIPPLSTAPYRGRFAPSPSGPLHLGSMFTALASYLEARSRGGEWWVRIDDIDPHRTQAGAADRILFSLESLGLTWDGTVVYQSHRSDRYRAGLDVLKAQRLIYACDCSRRELSEEATGLPNGSYPGFCRHKHLPQEGENLALRAHVGETLVSFNDRVQGSVTQDLGREVGDFIVYRRDGAFAYHLATVMDDADQGITEVLRGQDLLESTPRQIFLQQRLNLPTPAYAHIPILLNPDGQKLSKRTLAPEAETRHPGSLLGYLLGLLQHPLPPELVFAPVTDILAWARDHWQLSRLRGLGPASVTPPAFTA